MGVHDLVDHVSQMDLKEPLEAVREAPRFTRLTVTPTHILSQKLHRKPAATAVTAACWGLGGRSRIQCGLYHTCSIGSQVAPAQGSDPTGPTSLAAVHRNRVIKHERMGNQCLVG